MYTLDVDPDLTYIHLELKSLDILIINHFVSGADGPDALEMLEQSRLAMLEFESGKASVKMASQSDIEDIFNVEVRDNPDEETV